ncbi:radical SAM additional 4Fe4S-binding SPASM domain protein [Salinivirga cyanobacteriivorans]|uniref:Radical SAM additional 4Fe4S-binding SPASM domain protein n=1 Tax=Salinivirga cyanobacteriivorans TaxID=1307839 RepID=A0A0S2HVQ8_9BACT|nr:radical SAM additional 4Fe4S-binding SPASM domain protein [Salinivirga cyanobacteriivorans]
MARRINSYLIDPKGNLYKCWEHIGNKDLVIKNLVNEKLGSNVIHTRYLTGADPFENEYCKTCNLLPICSGGCPNHIVKNHFENTNYDECSYYKALLSDKSTELIN